MYLLDAFFFRERGSRVSQCCCVDDEVAQISLSTMSNTYADLTGVEEDNEDSFADVGFMFDSLQPSTLKRFKFTTARQKQQHEEEGQNNNSEDDKEDKIHVALHVVDEDPGAVQSGHYLWPGAPALASFLIDSASRSSDDGNTNTDNNNGSSINNGGGGGCFLPQPRSMIELGAGCALVSLACLQLFKDTLHCVVITDHDPGTLERARDNYETTMEDSLDRTSSLDDDQEQMDCINVLTSIPVEFLTLSWGETKDVKEIRDKIITDHLPTSTPLATPKTSPTPTRSSSPTTTTTTTTTSTTTCGRNCTSNNNKNSNEEEDNNKDNTLIFDLVVGSDLIYDYSVVEPLFLSVGLLLRKQYDSSFFLSQSFVYDQNTENEIDRMCESLQLERRVFKDNLQDVDGVKIQRFRWIS